MEEKIYESEIAVDKSTKRKSKKNKLSISKKSLLKGIILKEILDSPKSKRRSGVRNGL